MAPSRSSSAGLLGLLLAAAGVVAWVLLDPWRPLPLPGADEAEALGAGAAGPPLPAPAGGARRRPLAAVPAGGRLEVLDAATHRPLAGTEVFLWGPPVALVGVTGPEGLLELPEGLDPARLLLRRSGHLGLLLSLDTPFSAGLREGLARGRGRLALAPDPVTRLLAGEVRLPGGGPGAGAEVRLLALEPGDPARLGPPPALAAAWRMAVAVESLCRGEAVAGPWELGRLGPEVRASAGRDGRFSFRTLSTGAAWLEARGAGSEVARLFLRLPAGDALRLELQAGSWFRVMAAGGGRVEARTAEGWEERGEAGGVLGPFRPGEGVRLRLQPPGEETLEAWRTAPAAGRTEEVAFPGRQLRLWQARVDLRGGGALPEGVEARVRGGAAGRLDGAGWFSLALPEAGPVAVLFQGPGVQNRELLLDPAGPLPERVELLPAGEESLLAAGLIALVEGQVVGAGGTPLAGAQVRAQPREAAMPGDLRPAGRMEGRTGNDGSFRLLLPAPQSYRLVALHLEDGRGELELQVRGGERRREVRVALSPPARVAGLVRQEGRPVAGALVTFSRPGQATAQTRTGADGAFQVRLWTGGRWRVEALLPGGGRAEAEAVVAAGEELRLDLDGPKGGG